VVSTVAQIAIGAEFVVSLIYAQRILEQDSLPWPINYGWLMGALGLGSVIGGLVIGAAANRAPKGPLTIAGFVGVGVSLVLAGLVTNPYLAIVIFFFGGVANMLFLIPTITLFQQRTPQRLFGRVVSTRQALTFGAMSLAMGVSGWLAGEIGADMVFVYAGAITVVAGLSGLLVPAMRDAR
jgi:MFS family permease